MDAAYFNERFVYAAANQFFDLPLDDFLARLFIFRGYSLHSPLGMVCYDFILPEFVNYVPFLCFFLASKFFDQITASFTLSQTVLHF